MSKCVIFWSQIDFIYHNINIYRKKASRWDQTPQYTAAAAAVKLPEWTKPGEDGIRL